MKRVEKCRICGKLYNRDDNVFGDYNDEDKTVCPSCRRTADNNSKSKIIYTKAK